MNTIERLTALRRQHQWSQTATARRLNVKVRTLRAWEHGERHPKPIVLWAIEAFISQNSQPVIERAT